MTTNLLEQHAREKASMPEDWTLFVYEALPHSPEPTQFFKLQGAVAPLVTKGPRKGQRNWRKKDPTSQRVVYINTTEHDVWLARWSAKTGKCWNCEEGREWCGWSADKGHAYRKCHLCKGTGLSQNKLAADAERRGLTPRAG